MADLSGLFRSHKPAIKEVRSPVPKRVVLADHQSHFRSNRDFDPLKPIQEDQSKTFIECVEINYRFEVCFRLEVVDYAVAAIGVSHPYPEGKPIGAEPVIAYSTQVFGGFVPVGHEHAATLDQFDLLLDASVGLYVRHAENKKADTCISAAVPAMSRSQMMRFAESVNSPVTLVVNKIDPMGF